MKPALLDWAAREQYPVHHAAITYRTAPHDPPARLAVCWWGTMPFGSHFMGVLRMKGFDAFVDFAAEPVRAASRGELADRLQHAIAARFVPVSDPDDR
jgi:hypothetical protein